MKKTIFSAIFLLVFTMYALYQHFGGSGAVISATNDIVTIVAQPAIAIKKSVVPLPVKKNVSVETENETETEDVNTPTPTSPLAPVPSPTPTSTPIPTPPPVAPSGMYKDGSYTGSVADAYYGNIQVLAVVQNGKLTDVQFLQYPSDRSRSVAINTRAMPILKSEAISAQSASVDIVSGATASSQAFIQSLGSALTQARA